MCIHLHLQHVQMSHWLPQCTWDQAGKSSHQVYALDVWNLKIYPGEPLDEYQDTTVIHLNYQVGKDQWFTRVKSDEGGKSSYKDECIYEGGALGIRWVKQVKLNRDMPKRLMSWIWQCLGKVGLILSM